MTFLFNHSKGKGVGQKLLGFIFYNFAIFALSQLILIFSKNKHYIIFGNILSQFAFLFGPLIYFYLKSIFNRFQKINKQDFVYIIPFIIAIIFILTEYFIYANHKISMFELSVLRFSIWIQNLVYLLASVHLLKLNGLSIPLFFTYIKDEKLKWARFFISGCVISWFVMEAAFIFWDILKIIPFCRHLLNIYLVLILIFINTILYPILKKSKLLQSNNRYQDSIISDNDKEQYKERLLLIMDKEKPYFNPDLTLIDLSKNTKIPMRYLSQVINEKFQQNFYDFIDIRFSKKKAHTSNDV